MSQSELARRIGVPFQRVNDVVHARRAVTASTALINQALREYITDKTEPLEEKIRRVVREEVAKYGEE